MLMKKIITLLLVLTGMVLTVSADDMYIVGDAPFGGWKTNAGTSMTDNGDGTFSYEYTPASDVTCYFCIASALTSGAAEWATFNANSYRPTSKGTTFVQFEPITLSSTDGNNSVGMSFKEGVTYTFKFTKSTKELIVFSSVIPNLYLRSNLDATSENSWKTWDAAFSALTDYKFTSDGWQSDSKKLKYSYNVTSDKLATMIANGSDDFYFRIQNDDNDMPQMRPNGDHTFTFTDGKYAAGYDGYSNNSNYTGTTSKFIVSHSTLNAAVYKVTVYVGCNNWGRSYNTSVEIVSMPVSVGAKGYATYCNSTSALDFTGKSIQAYTISSTDGSALTLNNKLKVAKNEPVLLYSSTNSDSKEIPVIESGDATADATNKLVKGSGTALTWAVGSEYYVLATATVDPGFYKANNNTVATDKAYLDLRGLAAAHSFTLDLDEGNTTGIANISSEKEAMNGAFYNLAGQKVAQPTKGLYIMNGKKVIIK